MSHISPSSYLISKHPDAKPWHTGPGELPPVEATEFGKSRSAEESQNYASLLGELIGGTDGKSMATHFGGVFNCVNKEGITQDMLLSMQGCIHHAFFDLIGEEGFDIRNLTIQ